MNLECLYLMVKQWLVANSAKKHFLIISFLFTFISGSLAFADEVSLVEKVTANLCNQALSENTGQSAKWTRLIDSGILHLADQALKQKAQGKTWDKIELHIQYLRSELDRMRNELVERNIRLDARLAEYVPRNPADEEFIDNLKELRDSVLVQLDKWMDNEKDSSISLQAYNLLSFKFVQSIDQSPGFPEATTDFSTAGKIPYEVKRPQDYENFVALPYHRGFHPEIDLFLFAHGINVWEVATTRRPIDGINTLRPLQMIAEHDYYIHGNAMRDEDSSVNEDPKLRLANRIRVFEIIQREILDPLRHDRLKYELTVFTLYLILHEGENVPFDFGRMVRRLSLALQLTEQGSINELHRRLNDPVDFGGPDIRRLRPTLEQVNEAAEQLLEKLRELAE